MTRPLKKSTHFWFENIIFVQFRESMCACVRGCVCACVCYSFTNRVCPLRCTVLSNIETTTLKFHIQVERENCSSGVTKSLKAISSYFFSKNSLKNFQVYPGYQIIQRQKQSSGGALKNFAKFTGKQLCKSLFFNKVAGLRPVTLLKNRLWHWYFPVNFAKFLRTPFLNEPLRWLLLQRVLSNWPIFTSLPDVFLITVNCKHFDNKRTHYMYSNEYFDTKIISLLKP